MADGATLYAHQHPRQAEGDDPFRAKAGQDKMTEELAATTAANSTSETSGVAENILAIFERLGLKNTQPRRLIALRLAALSASASDFTAQDLWQDLLVSDPHIGRATVYRAVDILLGKGILDRVTFPDGTHRYRLCGTQRHHHHLTCTQCQRVIEVSACLPPELLATIANGADFALEGHSIELYGRCAQCRGRP